MVGEDWLGLLGARFISSWHLEQRNRRSGYIVERETRAVRPEQR